MEPFFLVTGPLFGEFTGNRWIHRTKEQEYGLWSFVDVGPHKLLNKQSNGRWFETTRCSCDRGLKNDRHFADIFKWIFFDETAVVSCAISWNLGESNMNFPWNLNHDGKFVRKVCHSLAFPQEEVRKWNAHALLIWEMEFARKVIVLTGHPDALHIYKRHNKDPSCRHEMGTFSVLHDDVIKWKHFPRYWSFVRGIHRPLVNSLHKGQWRGALMFSLICA